VEEDVPAREKETREGGRESERERERRRGL